MDDFLHWTRAQRGAQVISIRAETNHLYPEALELYPVLDCWKPSLLILLLRPETKPAERKTVTGKQRTDLRTSWNETFNLEPCDQPESPCSGARIFGYLGGEPGGPGAAYVFAPHPGNRSADDTCIRPRSRRASQYRALLPCGLVAPSNS
jgi:hypothetical protein